MDMACIPAGVPATSLQMVLALNMRVTLRSWEDAKNRLRKILIDAVQQARHGLRHVARQKVAFFSRQTICDTSDP